MSWLLFFSSVLAVREVAVSGSQMVTPSEVEQALDIPAGIAMAALDVAQLEKQVEAIPAVRDARVSRSWPARIEVVISDRSPVGTVSLNGRRWLIDDTGTPYVAAADVEPDVVAELMPIDVKDPGDDDLATQQAIAVLSDLPAEIRGLVASISAPSAAAITLHLQDGRTVIWGDSSQAADKITMLPGVLEHSGTVFDISSPQAIVIG